MIPARQKEAFRDRLESPKRIGVECVSLDDDCNTESASDLIQRDVERTECEVLHGAPNTLRRSHPTIE